MFLSFLLLFPHICLELFQKLNDSKKRDQEKWWKLNIASSCRSVARQFIRQKAKTFPLSPKVSLAIWKHETINHSFSLSPIDTDFGVNRTFPIYFCFFSSCCLHCLPFSTSTKIEPYTWQILMGALYHTLKHNPFILPCTMVAISFARSSHSEIWYMTCRS